MCSPFSDAARDVAREGVCEEVREEVREVAGGGVCADLFVERWPSLPAGARAVAGGGVSSSELPFVDAAREEPREEDRVGASSKNPTKSYGVTSPN